MIIDDFYRIIENYIKWKIKSGGVVLTKEKNKGHVKKAKRTSILRYVWVFLDSSYSSVLFVFIQGCGGGGSVRRRNTLHEVGGRQFLSQARFMGRENILL
jgi:hypothetical protein